MYRPASSVSSAAGGRVGPESTVFGDRDMIVSPSGGDGGPSGSPNPDQDEYTRGAFGSSTSGRSGPESPHADRRTRRSTVVPPRSDARRPAATPQGSSAVWERAYHSCQPCATPDLGNSQVFGLARRRHLRLARPRRRCGPALSSREILPIRRDPTHSIDEAVSRGGRWGGQKPLEPKCVLTRGCEVCAVHPRTSSRARGKVVQQTAQTSHSTARGGPA